MRLSSTDDIIAEAKRLDKSRMYLNDLLEKKYGISSHISQTSMWDIWRELRDIMEPKIYCSLHNKEVRTDFCIGCSEQCQKMITEYKPKFIKHRPEGESSFAIKTEACDLRSMKMKDFGDMPIAQFVELDPNGTKQHEMGAKLDAHKVKAGVLGDFGRALMAVSEVGTFGIKKYARGSWQYVPDGVERYTDALYRHLLQETKESTDPDSGLPHEFHVAWNALARLELLLREREQLLKERKTNISLPTTDKTTPQS